MTSFLVFHKELNRFSPPRNPAEEASLAGLKEKGHLLPHPWSTRTTPGCLGPAQGGGPAKKGWLIVLATLVIGFVWPATPLRAQFVYVANLNSNNISAYSIVADGSLTPVPGSPFKAGSRPQSVALHPTNKFAYVANDGSNNISAYSIAANGVLTPIPGSPFKAGLGSDSVAVDPTGKFAYVANQGDDTVSAYSIGADGSLTQVTGSPFAAGDTPGFVAVDPTGKFAYVTNYNGANVSAYSIRRQRGPETGQRFALRSGDPAPISGRGSNGQVRLRG